MSEVRVIGAGFSGLATAWYLSTAGHRVRVIEAGPRPGGLIRTRRVPEGLVETAAPAFTRSERTDSLFQAAGVEPCSARKQSAKRYIYRGGRPRRWPLTPLETAGAALRFGGASARGRVRPRAGESVATWGRRVLGNPAMTWLIAPALQGIYASSPEVLSASAIFGARRGRRGSLVTARGGMGELIDGLYDELRGRGVSFSFDEPAVDVDPQVPTAICTSAPVAARLVAAHAPRVAAALQRIRMVSLVTVTAFFEPRPDDLHGFGVLFPRSCGIRALGVLFNDEIFPGRSALRSETWIYGDSSPAALPCGGEPTRRQLAADRFEFTCRRDPPVACYATVHTRALPLYDAAVLDAIRAIDELPPSLALAGNYLGRLGVSRLLDAAAEAADRLRTVA